MKLFKHVNKLSLFVIIIVSLYILLMVIYHTYIPSDIYRYATKNTWKVDSSNVGFRFDGSKGVDSLNLSSLSIGTQLWFNIYLQNLVSNPLRIDSAIVFSASSGRTMKCPVFFPLQDYSRIPPLIFGYNKNAVLIGIELWKLPSFGSTPFGRDKNMLVSSLLNHDFIAIIYSSRESIKVVPSHYIIYDNILRVFKDERL